MSTRATEEEAADAWLQHWAAQPRPWEAVLPDGRVAGRHALLSGALELARALGCGAVVVRAEVEP